MQSCTQCEQYATYSYTEVIHCVTSGYFSTLKGLGANYWKLYPSTLGTECAAGNYKWMARIAIWLCLIGGQWKGCNVLYYPQLNNLLFDTAKKFQTLAMHEILFC